MLELENIALSYGSAAVLHDVTMHVDEGEIVALLGSNGVGKTTTLKAISGMERIREGSIRFRGQDISRMDSATIAHLEITHCPEGRRLFPRMSVEENLLLGAVTPRARAESARTLAHVYEEFSVLRTRRKQMAGLMSGGEQQMAAIGRAIMARPALMILDEPSLGLAPLIVKQVFQAIDRIRQEGVTVLLVEQNVQQALSVADRGYVLDRGRIILSGSAQELLHDDNVRRTYLGV